MGKEVPEFTRKQAEQMLKNGDSKHSIHNKLGVSKPWISDLFKDMDERGDIPPHPGKLVYTSKTAEQNTA